MVKILLVGCGGRMGKMISEVVKKYEDIVISAGIDSFNSMALDYPVFKQITECDIPCDVILDFSRPDALDSILQFSDNKNLPVVMCTTGFSDEQIKKIEDFSKTHPLFRSGNMSVGINIVNNILKNITKLLYGDFDIEIIEKHHNQKVDAPSGTALLLADTIKASIEDETIYVKGRDGIRKRDKNEIGIHAIRGGAIIGEHDVIFAGQGEVIEIKHSAISREVFAVGAIRACFFMVNQNAGLYNMDDVLKI